ncbi:hypothetical protein J6590_078598 [Homalodisca vitripennis]|nr:hypothetical protein J6590_078598 [Homalodisca vitripennis]
MFSSFEEIENCRQQGPSHHLTHDRTLTTLSSELWMYVLFLLAIQCLADYCQPLQESQFISQFRNCPVPTRTLRRGECVPLTDFDHFRQKSGGHNSGGVRGIPEFEEDHTYGVIQGSTLTPILFLIYKNNSGKINMENGKIFLYADDIDLCFEGSNWQEVYEAAERGLNIAKRWFDQNELNIN